ARRRHRPRPEPHVLRKRALRGRSLRRHVDQPPVRTRRQDHHRANLGESPGLLSRSDGVPRCQPVGAVALDRPGRTRALPLRRRVEGTAPYRRSHATTVSTIRGVKPGSHTWSQPSSTTSSFGSRARANASRESWSGTIVSLSPCTSSHGTVIFSACGAVLP